MITRTKKKTERETYNQSQLHLIGDPKVRLPQLPIKVVVVPAMLSQLLMLLKVLIKSKLANSFLCPSNKSLTAPETTAITVATVV